ncbi:hypothetical protein [Metabacillus bambusae]|uniref:HeH/LEM domain-containing protein n=1 Tax=Metabacillus bambusae TaxID=2795218 RepID=A0ABS3NBR2_9BACI|nr:hypothetical protein [Metabacillus bambusae]MBO1515600.1 hypothetical protein [Metabacillus bambusae]
MATIKSPNPQYTGVSASLPFVKGEAKTEDPWLVGWFKNKGYEVVEEDQLPNNPPTDPPSEIDISKLTKDEIKAKLDELNVDFKSDDNKDVLIEKLNEVTETGE